MRSAIVAVVMLVIFAVASAHRPSEIDKGYPKPPPTTDPGPDAATLNIIVKDQDTGERVSATVSINQGAQEPDDDPYRQYALRRSANRHKGPLRFRKIDYYFYTDGSFRVKVPPGTCTVEVRKGYEYRVTRRVFQLEKNEVTEATVFVSRWTDMAKKGWYSGDTHIHFDRNGNNDDTLVTLTSAKDLRYAFILSMNTRGYDRGREFESWHQAQGLGEGSLYRKGPYRISSGQEYRVGTLGHVTIVLGDDYVPGVGRREDVNLGPSLGVIADQAHQLRGFIGLNHGGYHREEADSLALRGKLDFLELLQFGDYLNLGLEGWYDFLNIGYRWPIVAACDFPYTRELGDNITYVHSEPEPSVREFMNLIARGKSTVTSGPMLFVKVNGKRPGEFITLDEERESPLEVEVEVSSPLYPVRYVDVIRNGHVVSKKFAPEGRTQWNFTDRLNIQKSGWVAVRAYGDAGTESHTNPVYIYMGGKLPFDDDASGQILARLDGSIRTIPNAEIVEQLKEIKQRLVSYRETRDGRGLALPSVPGGN